MSNKLTVVANIQAVPGKADFVKSELLKLIDPTRVEEGCINYDLHQDNSDPNRFVFFENWESKELLLKHLGSSHIAAYRAATKGAILDFSLHELTQIG